MVRIALLDMYEGVENQGMRGIREIIHAMADYRGVGVQLDEFNVRQKAETPDLSYNIYVSTGGPGSPLESEGNAWEKAFFQWLYQVEQWNADAHTYPKKHVFFICHSFQLICRHYKVGQVCKRRSTSFGVLPVHMLGSAQNEPVFNGLRDPFYAVDSRDFQVIQPNHSQLRKMGASILCIEKERPHIPLERAIMAIRFSEYFIGTQFHPEADAIGMSMYLQREDRKKVVIENHGEEKWRNMLEHLSDPDKILLTHDIILPNFLRLAYRHISGVSATG
jgi:GMP synthase-like glutamine amidotransferase